MKYRLLLVAFALCLIFALPACLSGLVDGEVWGWSDSSEDTTSEDGTDTDEQSQEDLATDTDEGLAPGALCTGSSQCLDDYVCLPYSDSESRCSAICDTADVFCSDGAHCISLQNLDYGACASYGSGGLDALCDGKLDCQKSMACFTDTEGDGRCKYTCDFDEDEVPCLSGWSCTITTAGLDFGLCVEN